ncbi:hypothetical protein [Pseudooceanicola sp.]|uniref:hypothetical protein n=1 Tax=Pseudooceanicola sp. TaxID=1914328 RepID=UPI002603ED19|nr:hypothetical protein [Pseudooceanicola sp.]MDF1856864.1 hypothetical protein [Pseudooceanicola sp.]
MLSWILISIALMLSTASGGGSGAISVAEAATDEPAYRADPQTPTGKFTTAAEIKQIMTLTKGNWVAIREFDGQDLVYVTQILAWRCGLAGLRFAVNGAPLQDWPMPVCDEESAQPNAITGDDALIYRRFPLGSVQSVEVELIYDDLTRDQGAFQRKQVLMP